MKKRVKKELKEQLNSWEFSKSNISPKGEKSQRLPTQKINKTKTQNFKLQMDLYSMFKLQK